MVTNQEVIKELREEVIENGKGCIVFDFACLINEEDNPKNPFVFDMAINGKMLDDVKLNHRYPNKKYYTISKKYGRKLSKIGYPYFVDLSDTEQNMKIDLEIGRKNETISFEFLLHTLLTKENPVCVLELNQIFDKKKIEFATYRRGKHGNPADYHVWKLLISGSSRDWEDYFCEKENESRLPVVTSYGKPNYRCLNIIEPFPQKLDELCW